MKQITIVCESCPGVMAEIVEALDTADVKLESLDAESFGSSGVIILRVDRYDAALQALAKTPYQAISEDAMLIQIDDRPGELARIMKRFGEAEINLRSIHIVRRDAGKSIVAISTRRGEETRELVKDVLIS